MIIRLSCKIWSAKVKLFALFHQLCIGFTSVKPNQQLVKANRLAKLRFHQVVFLVNLWISHDIEWNMD
jgi:hypothetical protein